MCMVTWQVDLAPTILGLAGLPAASTFDGKSIVPLLIPNATVDYSDHDGNGSGNDTANGETSEGHWTQERRHQEASPGTGDNSPYPGT